MSKILLIDDDLNFRDLVKLKLSSFLPSITFIEYSDLTTFKNEFDHKHLQTILLVVLDQNLPDGLGSDLLRTNIFQDIPVLSVSNDVDPSIPGNVILSGANQFLNKFDVKERLFEPLVKALIAKHQLTIENSKLREEKIKNATIRTLISTLRHEINNPLGAVLGAVFLAQQGTEDPKVKEAIGLIELSSKRIKYVIEKLGEQLDLNPVSKSDVEVYHIQGDKPWKE